MAPNGATSRKTPTAVSGAATMTDGPSFENEFNDIENEPDGEIVDGLKKDLEKPKSFGIWTSEQQSTGVNGVTSKEPSSNVTTAISRVASRSGKAFASGQPMGDRSDFLKCTHCKRAVSKYGMPKHIEGCLNKKQEKQRKKKEAKDARDAAARREKAGDSDEEEDGGADKTAIKTGGLPASKKRKAADEGEEGVPTKKKKKKDEAKAKAPRPKAPVDVEKQCGVQLDNGGQCARSLTCKSHSMGAKRAVPGRSAPYDKLLMEYQRKNQAKLQKAAFDANAPNPDDDSLPSGPVDSEEEKDVVMASIARSWGGQPIYQPVHVPLRKKYEWNRIQGMMGSAFANRRTGAGSGVGSGTMGGFFGSAPASLADLDRNPPTRRESVVPAARTTMPAPSRKPSVAPAGA